MKRTRIGIDERNLIIDTFLVDLMEDNWTDPQHSHWKYVFICYSLHMAKKDTDNNKLIAYRLIVLGSIAFLLVQLHIVTDSMSGSRLGLYIFALIIALPITMLLDKFIVAFVKNGSLK